MDFEIPNRAITAGKPPVAQSRVDLRLVNDGNSRRDSNTARASQQQSAESEREVAQRLENSVNELNDLVQSVQRDLQFSIDELSGSTVIKVLDTKTDEVIRQIPSEEVLALTRNIESLKGVLFSAEV